MKNYHVLSNVELIVIFMYGILGAVVLVLVFSWLARRDAITEEYKKGVFAKTIPWFVLCLLISAFSVFVYSCVIYPWEIEPQPSKASIFREIRYNNNGEPIFGWANDLQRPLLSAYANCVLLLCWTFYAFKFKPSNTSWWKKTCKIVSYIILSAIIAGFNLHGYRDFVVYAVIISIIAILLWVARVKPKEMTPSVLESDKNGLRETVEIKNTTTQSEDLTRFMPPAMREAVLAKQRESAVDVELDTSPKQIVNQTSKHNNDILVSTEQSEEIIKDGSNTQTDYLYCKHCGKRVELDSAFCKYCGGKM